jgi:DNA-binding IclR family transcriptional regulator
MVARRSAKRSSLLRQETEPRGTGQPRSPKIVDALIRGLTILEELSRRPEGATVTELAVMEGVNKALAHRALASLAVAGFVYRDPLTGRYRLTGRVLTVATTYYRGLGMTHQSTAILQSLADATASSAQVSRYMDGALRIMLTVQPRTQDAIFQVISRAGTTQALHATAAGKVWLASLDEQDLERFLSTATLPKLGPRTITDVGKLKAHIAKVRKQGCAFNREEDLYGVFAVAVPILSADGQHGGATLALVRPVAATSPANEARLLKALRATADELSELLPAWEPLS